MTPHQTVLAITRVWCGGQPWLYACLKSIHCQVPNPSAQCWSSSGPPLQRGSGLGFSESRAVLVLQVFSLRRGDWHKQRHVSVSAALQALPARKMGAGRKKGWKVGESWALFSASWCQQLCVPSPSLHGVNKVDFRRGKAFVLFIQDYIASAIACDFKCIVVGNLLFFPVSLTFLLVTNELPWEAMLQISCLAMENSSCPLDGVILAMLFKPEYPLSPTVSGMPQAVI